ncbi:Fimbrial biogenesis outer membrane usher protein [Enterobacterales bacterium 8AC]|nr:Fimbrial biogenesis outer membrane usher protein [Enterobacterales bacterium 8AC]
MARHTPRQLHPSAVKRLQRSFLSLMICTIPLLGVVCISESVAQSSAPGTHDDKYQIPDNPEVYLDVELNGVQRGVYSFELRHDELWGLVSTLEEMGLKIPPAKAPSINLMSLEGIKVDYQTEVQRLVLTVNEAHVELPRSVFTNVDTQTYPGSSASGVLLNYEAFATHSDNAETASLFSELRAFNPLGTLSNTALSQFNDSIPSKVDTIRLDTTLNSSWQESMVTLRAGDAITGNLSWSRGTRFAGLQLARNFDLNPYLVSSPLLEFLGTTTTPSNVDLLIDGVKQYSTPVPPGPFVINTLPRINGYGNAQLVVTDALGQSKTLDLPIFFSPSLLSKGLADWSLDAGKVRLNYGKSSFDYSEDTMFSSKLRYGLTSSLTLENQMETTAGLFKQGVGIVATPSAYLGVFSGSYAQSRYQGMTGEQKGFGYQWSNRDFNLGGSILTANADYRDIASLYGATLNAKSQQLFLGVSLGDAGSVSVSHLTQTPMEQATTRFVNVSWLKNLGETVSLNLLLNRNLNDRKDYSIYLGVSVALQNKMNVSAGTTYRQRGVVNAVSATRNAPSDGGLAWRASAVSEKGHQTAQADIEYLTQRARLTAGANSQSDLYLGGSGSVVLMKGHSFMAKQLNDAFAVVSTAGVPDVPVLLENRLVGKTDEAGFLLVSPLYSYQKNQLSIDSLELPPGYDIAYTNTVAVPKDRTGSYVEFPIKPAYAATVVLVNQRGEYLPVGTEVFIKGQKQSYIVGFDGAVYLEGLTDNPDLEAHLPKERNGVGGGAVCHAKVTYSADKENIGTSPQTECVPAQ